jgi:autophagy-related protein 101
MMTMEQRRAPEYIIEVFASPESVKDVVRGSVDVVLLSAIKRRC